MTGMTVEVLGTLVGAAIQGQIVASAHTLKHCPTHNVSAGYLGNSSGAEIVKSLVHSQDYLSHAVSVTVRRRRPRWAQTRPQGRFGNSSECQQRSSLRRVYSRRFAFAKCPSEKGDCSDRSITTERPRSLTSKWASCFNPRNPRV